MESSSRVSLDERVAVIEAVASMLEEASEACGLPCGPNGPQGSDDEGKPQ